MKGIDVAHYQGAIDWHEVAASGVGWAACKVTEGAKGVDPTGPTNAHGMLEAGIKYRLMYHFLTPDDAGTQAAHFWYTTKDLPLAGYMLDIEQYSEITVELVVAFLNALEEFTKRPTAIYCGRYFNGGNIWYSNEVYYGGKYGPRPRIFPAAVSESHAHAIAAPQGWDVWQYGVGGVPGVPVLCDLDQVDVPEAFDRCCGLAPTQQPTTEDEDIMRSYSSAGGQLVLSINAGNIRRVSGNEAAGMTLVAITGQGILDVIAEGAVPVGESPFGGRFPGYEDAALHAAWVNAQHYATPPAAPSDATDAAIAGQLTDIAAKVDALQFLRPGM